MKSKIIAFILMVLVGFNANAQSWLENHHDELKVKNPNLYFHVDVNSGNVYTMAASTVLLGYINYGLKRNVFETGYVMDFISAKNGSEKIKTKMNSPLGFRCSELFNDIMPDIKLGYKSNSPGGANWGIYVDVKYKMHQFKMDCGNKELDKFRYSRVGFGGGIMGIFGKLTDPYHVIIEAGACYNIPLSFNTTAWTDSDSKQLSKGVTSHFSVKFGGADSFQNIGLFVDIDHNNLFDSNFEKNNIRLFNDLTFKNVCVGVSFSVTIGQTDKR